MAPPSWANALELNFLKTWIAEYIKRQGQHKLNLFWPALQEAWFAQFPERARLGLPSGEALLTNDQMDVLRVAIVARKKKLENWFRYQRTRLNSARAAGTRVNTPANVANAIFRNKPPRCRRHQAIEIWQKRNAEALRLALAARGFNELNEEHAAADRDTWENETEEAASERVKEMRRERMKLRTAVVQELWANADPAERAICETLVAAERDAPLNPPAPPIAAEPTPEERQLLSASSRAIDETADVFTRVNAAYGERTGWKGIMIWGGPNPRMGGELSMKVICYGTSPAGNTFEESLTTFDEDIVLPFQKWMRCSFNTAPAVRAARALNSTPQLPAEPHEPVVVEGVDDPQDVTPPARGSGSKNHRQAKRMPKPKRAKAAPAATTVAAASLAADCMPLPAPAVEAHITPLAPLPSSSEDGSQALGLPPFPGPPIFDASAPYGLLSFDATPTSAIYGPPAPMALTYDDSFGAVGDVDNPFLTEDQDGMGMGWGDADSFDDTPDAPRWPAGMGPPTPSFEGFAFGAGLAESPVPTGVLFSFPAVTAPPTTRPAPRPTWKGAADVAPPAPRASAYRCSALFDAFVTTPPSATTPASSFTPSTSTSTATRTPLAPARATEAAKTLLASLARINAAGATPPSSLPLSAPPTFSSPLPASSLPLSTPPSATQVGLEPDLVTGTLRAALEAAAVPAELKTAAPAVYPQSRPMARLPPSLIPAKPKAVRGGRRGRGGVRGGGCGGRRTVAVSMEEEQEQEQEQEEQETPSPPIVAVAAKRGVGRPKKNATAAADAPSATPPTAVKHAVGRPRKNPTAIPAAAAADDVRPRQPLRYSSSNTMAFNRKVEADQKRRREVEAEKKKRLVEEAEAASDFLLRPNPNGDTPTIIFKRKRVAAKLPDGTAPKPQVKLTRVQMQNLQSENRLLEQMGKKRAAPEAGGSVAKRRRTKA
ncbi:hypothetical protein C8R44DRAFT_730442 [Mycena epipterygia]|nr:hypothetical protein C8R44DRAFT_730442 [Mycena epipterygia]